MLRLYRGVFDRFFGYDVFISYSRKHSNAYARSLQSELQAIGIACFLDERDIYAGAPLDSTITTAIGRSSAVVPIICKGTSESKFVPGEVSAAIDAAKQIIPISVAEEIRESSWQQIQQYRWINEQETALRGGSPTPGVAADIRQNFVALRRAQFRRIVIGAIFVFFLAIGGLAYSGYRDAQIQQAFGLYARGLEAVTRKDDHGATLLFAKALTLHDAAQVRRALRSVVDVPQWRWDFQIPPDNGQGANDAPARIAFARDGKSLFVASGRTIFVLSSLDGALQKALRLADEVTAIAVDDRKGTVVVGDATGRIVLFADGTLADPRTLFVDGAVAALTFNADGALIGVGVRSRGLRVLDAATGELWFRSPPGQHERTVTSIAFAPNSSRMFWSMGRWLYASEPISQQLKLVAPQNNDINAVAWNADGKFVAVAGVDGPIQLLDQGSPSTGPNAILSSRRRDTPPLQELVGHRDGVTALRFLGRGQVLASVGYDGKSQLWNVGNSRLLFSVVAHDGAADDLAFSAEANLMATVGKDRRVRVWKRGHDFGAVFWATTALGDAASFSARSGGNTIDALVSTGEKSILLGHSSGSITSVDSQGTHRVVTLQQVMPRGQFLKMDRSGNLALAVSSKLASPRLAILGGDTIRLLRKTDSTWSSTRLDITDPVVDASWTHKAGEAVILTAGGSIVRGSIVGSAFTPSQTISSGDSIRPQILTTATRADVVAVADSGGTIVVFDKGQRVEHRVGLPVRQITLSPDGTLLAIVTIGAGARTSVWNVAKSKTVLEVRDWISDAAFDPSSRYLLLGSDPRDELALYDLAREDDKEFARWTAHGNGVRAVAFSPSGDLVYSAGNDGALRSWPVQPLRDIERVSPSSLFAQAERSTGLKLRNDDTVILRPVLNSKTNVEASLLALPANSRQSIEQVNAVLQSRDEEDKSSLIRACNTVSKAEDLGSGTPSTLRNVTRLAIIGVCANAAGEIESAKETHQAFYKAVTTEADVKTMAIWPALDRGIKAFLDNALKVRLTSEMARALELTNLELLASWREQSFVRLPAPEVLGRYNKVLSRSLQLREMRPIDERVGELVRGLGADWARRAFDLEEAELLPRLLLNVSVTHRLVGDDASAALSYANQAVDTVKVILERRVMTGDPAESQTRRLWLRTLGESASATCAVVAKAFEQKETIVDGLNTKAMLAQANKAARLAYDQWKSLEGLSAEDDEAVKALLQTVRRCMELDRKI